MKRDIRDPAILGEKLLESATQVRAAYATKKKPIPLSEVWDNHTCNFLIPDFPESLNCVDRYGDPTAIEPLYAEIRIR